jgi:hypothetical protein
MPGDRAVISTQGTNALPILPWGSSSTDARKAEAVPRKRNIPSESTNFMAFPLGRIVGSGDGNATNQHAGSCT